MCFHRKTLFRVWIIPCLLVRPTNCNVVWLISWSFFELWWMADEVFAGHSERQVYLECLTCLMDEEDISYIRYTSTFEMCTIHRVHKLFTHTHPHTHTYVCMFSALELVNYVSLPSASIVLFLYNAFFHLYLYGQSYWSRFLTIY